MSDTTIAKVAKVVFIIGLILFLFREQSLEALNILRGLFIKYILNVAINNILLVTVAVIFLLIYIIKSSGGKK